MTDPSTDEVDFGPYRLDAPNSRLLRDGKPVALTPKAFDVLRYLTSQPDRLVSKKELLSAVWPDVFVSDASVKVCVREIRKALRDSTKSPKYIQTIHRRGYRFIAAVAPAALASSGKPLRLAGKVSVAQSAPQLLVGREAELERLRDHFIKAHDGERQCIFITGGPGSGKTALIEAFVQQAGKSLESEEDISVLTGHCFEQFAASEPYMPVWEALGQLAREKPSAELSALLARHAEAYSTQPAVASAAHQSSQPVAIEPRTMSEHLLRALTDGLEALAAESMLILVLEDLHWADYSTLDLISALARRRGKARLMILVTYRPAEVAVEEHPLRSIVRGLLAARLCDELTLEFLDQPAVAKYLSARFAENDFPAALGLRLHQRTDGHPLFLVHLVDDLIELGVLQQTEGVWQLADAGGVDGGAWLAVLETQIPRTVQAMIEVQFQRLPDSERAALEAAAVAGVEFSAAAVAALLAGDGGGDDVVHAEQLCQSLAQRYHFLEARGIAEWPDATAATHYRFVHAMYHHVVYEQIPIGRRIQLHKLMGLRIEKIWGERAVEEAAALAMHFESGRDWARAVKYLRQAADAAGRQYAHREAVHYLRRALTALLRLTDQERGEHELSVLMSLGVNLQLTSGFASPEVEEIQARTYWLCKSRGSADAGQVRTTFGVLWGIWLFHKVRSDLAKSVEMSDQLLAMARQANDSALLLQAHQAMCVTHLCLGKPALTVDHMQQAAAIYDPARHAGNTERFGQDPGVATLAFGAVALMLMGRGEEALRASERSLELARRSLQPSSLALAMHFAAMLHQCRDDASATEQWSQSSVELASREGFSFWLAGGTVLRGWAWVARCAGRGKGGIMMAEAGVAEIRRGLDAWLRTGSRTYQTYYLGLLADALLRVGRPDEALTALDEAMAAARALPEGLYEAELHRLRARCLIESRGECDAAARECFQDALRVAQAQGAKLFESRAQEDLAGLGKQSGQEGRGGGRKNLSATSPAQPGRGRGSRRQS
jgi:predicted ATPase/DNA-binding winged helix-turn-helix (wHTH) protein